MYLVVCVGTYASPANTVIAIKSGPWVASDTWSCKSMPKRTDTIIIPQGIIVSVTHRLSLAPSEDGKPLVITVAGTLNISSASLFLDPIDRIIVMPGGKISSKSQGGAIFSGMYGVQLDGGTYARGPVTLGDNYAATLIHGIIAEKQEKGLNLSWRSSSEIEVNYYFVSRSVDGINFDNIAKIDGRGSRRQKVFEFADTNAPAGLVQYRIDLANMNGVDFAVAAVNLKIEPTDGTVAIVAEASSAGN